MDNLENYFYILFAVIYIISRIIKARSKQKKSTPQQQGQRRAQPTGQQQQKPKKTFSFEDILKEFEKNLAGEEEEVAHEKPLPVKEIKHEKPAPAPVKSYKNKPNKYESYQGKSIKEEIELERNTAFLRSENYSITDDVASEYVKMLQDPDGFKNAIVLSEIINRKYF
jgi:hypothetical protein